MGQLFLLAVLFVFFQVANSVPLCLNVGSSTLVAPFCQGRFSYDVYLDTDQATPANLALIDSINTLVLTSRAVLPRFCVNALADFYCQRLYPKCLALNATSKRFKRGFFCFFANQNNRLFFRTK